ncbi:Glycogen debranching enzyme [Liparis tanakae]|uniref:Glycogen debranching enzyme n=1 Tax=Liparis tanakae TaxID=230148 RepID=A0A4Z2E828_9TELE|nr:Glycogen debranching enzyme [Liparis tanakae]
MTRSQLSVSSERRHGLGCSREPGVHVEDLPTMFPQHLKQIRVLMINATEKLERSLFRLEQGVRGQGPGVRGALGDEFRETFLLETPWRSL